MNETTVSDLFLYRNDLGQTFRELLAERIRAKGGQFNHDHPECRSSRDKPFLDGIMIDLDEPDEVEYLVLGVTEVIREACGGATAFWSQFTERYLQAELDAAEGAA